jgi:hypothetical protein
LPFENEVIDKVKIDPERLDLPNDKNSKKDVHAAGAHSLIIPQQGKNISI